MLDIHTYTAVTKFGSCMQTRVQEMPIEESTIALEREKLNDFANVFERNTAKFNSIKNDLRLATRS